MTSISFNRCAMEQQEFDSLYLFAKSLQGVYRRLDQIELQLKQKSNRAELIAQVMDQLKRDRNAAKLSHGLIKLALGAMLLISSFVITCINYHSNQPFAVVMYGFTTAGLVLLLWGLYDLLN